MWRPSEKRGRTQRKKKASAPIFVESFGQCPNIFIVPKYLTFDFFDINFYYSSYSKYRKLKYILKNTI
jgi:hypothetical protein